MELLNLAEGAAVAGRKAAAGLPHSKKGAASCATTKNCLNYRDMRQGWGTLTAAKEVECVEERC